MGCNGGLMDNAFSWIEKNGGLCYEEDYEYVSGDTRAPGVCEKSCEVDEKSEIKSYTDVKSSDEAMMEALMKQPVSVAIEADEKDFQLYKSGIFNSSFCGEELDHGVAIVGYGSYRGLDYWLVKISWDTTWCDEGYIKILSGVNMCGIALKPSIPMM